MMATPPHFFDLESLPAKPAPTRKQPWSARFSNSALRFLDLGHTLSVGALTWSANTSSASIILGFQLRHLRFVDRPSRSTPCASLLRHFSFASASWRSRAM